MRRIKYINSVENINSGMLKGFFRGWKKPFNPDTHYKILSNSSYVVLAIDEDYEKVVGFINCLTDGIQCAFIPLLEVLTEYRNQGIGSELVKRMFGLIKSIYAVDLICDKEFQTFYSKFGMIKSTGMMIRNY